MILSEIMSVVEYEILSGSPESSNILDITTDSRCACGEMLFVCIKGLSADGHRFVSSAYTNGCRAFLVERPVDLPDDAVIIRVNDTREALAHISAKFCGYPAKKLKMIGITGTKGKTTTALMIRHAIQSCGHNIGYIGTCGVFLKNRIYHTDNTTPDSLELQKRLAEMVSEGDEYAVIEVSSQALKMDRVLGIDFELCIFTNLSRDHIGGVEHADLEEYMSCKKMLFTDHGAKAVIYNADDPAHDFMIAESSADRRISVSTKNKEADYYSSRFSGVRNGASIGIVFNCKHLEDKYKISLPFAGRFSMYNAMYAIAACEYFGFPIKEVVKSLACISVSGRFELLELKSRPNTIFIIDYAHNGVSLRSILESVRPFTEENGRVICVFGSVGGRTFERRRELGKVAAELADYSIITSDNPNFEPPENIAADIAAAFDGDTDKYEIIPDRKTAIKYATEISDAGDIVVFAGKGHERYQLISGQKVVFCEKEILQIYDYELLYKEKHSRGRKKKHRK